MTKPDDRIRELLSETKETASENLKFRIMQQIETEKSLQKIGETSSRPIFSNMFVIFGIMYILIAIIAGGVYSTMGESAFESVRFYGPVILISAICSVYWMITVFDERRNKSQ